MITTVSNRSETVTEDSFNFGRSYKALGVGRFKPPIGPTRIAVFALFKPKVWFSMHVLL